jgi:hypothetical protein
MDNQDLLQNILETLEEIKYSLRYPGRRFYEQKEFKSDLDGKKHAIKEIKSDSQDRLFKLFVLNDSNEMCDYYGETFILSELIKRMKCTSELIKDGSKTDIEVKQWGDKIKVLL